jgi:hypothetical protein
MVFSLSKRQFCAELGFPAKGLGGTFRRDADNGHKQISRAVSDYQGVARFSSDSDHRAKEKPN